MELLKKRELDGAGPAVLGDADQPLFEKLYADYFRKLVSDLTAAYGAGPPDPEDVAQRAFANLNKRGGLSAIRDLRGFLWITARNIIFSEKRSQAVRDRNETDLVSHLFGATSDELHPERVFIAKEQISIVADVLNAMSARRRRIFMLNRVHGLTPAEISRRIGIGRTAVVRHIGVATQLIEDAVEQEEGGGEAND